MIELGQLEKRHADFDKQNVRLIVSSLEGPDDAEMTQKQFPHLIVLSDSTRALSDAVGVIHKNSNPHGGDTSAPTTLIIDGHGDVRWTYSSGHVASRLSPSELLAELEKVKSGK